MTQTHIHTDADLDVGLAALRRADPRFAALMATAGRPPLRRRPDGFAGLAAIIVAQQLSTASAGAIWGRLAEAFDPFEPAVILRARATRLARLGLSAPKIRALKEIARAVAARRARAGNAGRPSRRYGARRADGRSWHRPVDGRHLSLVMPRSCRCLAGRRPCPAGSGKARLRACRHGRPPRRCKPWPNPGGRGAPWRRGCCGRITARPRQQNPPPAERRALGRPKIRSTGNQILRRTNR